MRQQFLLLVLLSAIFTACNSSGVFDQNTDIKGKQWSYDQILPFEVSVTDTTQQYNLYINLRHTNDYQYSNLWLMMRTTFPDGQTLDKRVDLPLADKQGKWYGSGMGDIITQQVLIQPNAIFPMLGKYKFELVQDMRLNPLPDVISAGLRGEVADQKKKEAPKHTDKTDLPKPK